MCAAVPTVGGTALPFKDVPHTVYRISWLWILH